MARKPQAASSKKRPTSPTTRVSSGRVGAATPSVKVKSPLMIAVAVAAIVGLLAIAAVIATSSKTGKSTVTGSDRPAAGGAASLTIETAAVKVTGTALSTSVESGPDTGIGATAPRLDGQTFDSSAVSIAPGSSPMVVVFVAHWCPHCQREVPLLAKWAVGGTRNNVAVRAVSTSVSSNRPNYPPSDWLSRENFTIPTMVDSDASTAAEAYGLSSFPYFVALDAKGKLVSRTSGEITEAQFVQLLNSAKGGTPK